MLIQRLTDELLHTQTLRIVKAEKHHTFKVLCHLCEIYKRRLYRDFNCNSLFEYCVKRLNYTPGEAQNRVSAVKLMHNSAKITNAIELGDLPLTNAGILQKHLEKKEQISIKQKEELAQKIYGKSKLDAINILEGEPLNPKKFHRKYKIEIDRHTLELIKELTTLAGTNKNKALKEAIQAQIKTLKATRKRQTQKPSPQQEKQTRYIPESEKAKVLQRAAGRCEYLNHEGERCPNTDKLQYDHITPFAVGGKNNAENLRLLCQGHNLRYAIQYYGLKKINRNSGITVNTADQSHEVMKRPEH